MSLQFYPVVNLKNVNTRISLKYVLLFYFWVK
jgi:hypothetical protein